MGLVSFVSQGVNAFKFLIHDNPNDKSYLKAKPEIFDRGEENKIHRLIGILNKEKKEKTVYDKNIAPIQINDMLNKSQEHLDCFILEARENEGSCNYLIENMRSNMSSETCKKRPEMKIELVNFIRNYVVDEIIKRADLVNKQKKSSEENKGNDIVSGGSSYSEDLNYGEAVIYTLKENMSKAAEKNEKFKPLNSGSGVEHISSDLANYINKQASYTVEPEKFKGLIMKYYEFHAQGLNLPSVKELDTLINKVVEEFKCIKELKYIKELPNSMVITLLRKPAGSRKAIHPFKYV